MSIVITSHNDPGTCYLTAFSARQQCPDEEIIIVADGGTEWKWENQQRFRCLRGNFGSPQASRDAGIRAASGDHVLVLESHVVVSDIKKLMGAHAGLGAAITFPIRVGEGPEMFDVFAHETDWAGNLWHRKLVYEAPASDLPRRVSQFGNSCFMLDRKWYLESGGYTDLLKGWGGEEPFIGLKAWMLGRECWQVPTVWHAHYLTFGQGISRPDLNLNLRVLGYLIAGRECPGVTPAMAEERRRIQAGPFGGDVAKLRKHLSDMGVV